MFIRLVYTQIMNLRANGVHLLRIIIIIIQGMTNEIVDHVPFSFSKELFDGVSGSHWSVSLVDLLKITDLQVLV